MESQANVISQESVLSKLSRVDDYVTDTHLLRIRLFFQLLGQERDAERAQHIKDFYFILTANPVYRHKALELIQYILTFVGVHDSLVQDIKQLDERALQDCKKLLAYSSAIVGVCIQISSKEFNMLKDVCCTHLNCHPLSITCMEHLCWKLHCHGSISSDNVNTLAQWLSDIGRADLSNGLMDYAQTGIYEVPVRISIGDEDLSRKQLQTAVKVEVKPVSQQTMTTDYLQDSALLTSDLTTPAAATLDGESQEVPVFAVGSIRPFEEGIRLATPPPEPIPHAANGGMPDVTTRAGAMVEPPPNSSVNATHPHPEPKLESDHDTIALPFEADLVNESTFLITLGPNRMMSTQSRSKGTGIFRLILVCMGLVILLALTGGVSAWLITYGFINITPSEPVYATEGETIIVSKLSDSLSLTWNSIGECLSSGDSSLSNKVYTVQGELVYHARMASINFTEVFNLTAPNCTNKLLPYPLYMLNGSSIDLEICLSASKEPEMHGTLLIFSDNKAYRDFILNNDCENTNGASLVHNLSIGQPGHFECSSISYSAKTNGHVYVISATPENVHYYFRYNYTQFYLDPNDLKNWYECTFSPEGNNYCPIGFITHPLYLIASVESNTLLSSSSTHLCLNRNWSIGLIALVVSLGIFAIVLSVITSLCLCKLCERYCTNVRNLMY